MTIFTAIRSITPAVISLLTPACSTLRTVEAPVGQKNTGRAFSGLHYFLPRGTISIEGSKGSDAAAEAAKYIITITRQNEADRKDRYRLITSANYLYDDTANFAITEKGLLNGVVTTKSDPRIKDIIDAFADAAVNVGKIVIKLNTGITPGPTSGTRGVGFDPENKTKLEPFRVTFDPFNKDEVDDAKNKMRHCGLTLVLDTHGQSGDVPERDTRGRDIRVTGRLSHRGISYRPLTTVKLGVSTNYDERIVHYTNVSIPDPSTIATFSLGRGILVTKTNAPTFLNGELTSLDFSYPSEVLGVATLAKDVSAKALSIVESAPDVVGLIYKPRGPKDPNQDLNGEIARLEAEKRRIELKKEIQQKKKENDALAHELKTSSNSSTSPKPKAPVAVTGTTRAVAPETVGPGDDSFTDILPILPSKEEQKFDALRAEGESFTEEKKTLRLEAEVKRLREEAKAATKQK